MGARNFDAAYLSLCGAKAAVKALVEFQTGEDDANLQGMLDFVEHTMELLRQALFSDVAYVEALGYVSLNAELRSDLSIRQLAGELLPMISGVAPVLTSTRCIGPVNCSLCAVGIEHDMQGA
jgi:hypothetical protein